MSDGPFDFVCAEVERASSLSALEARGTVRLALKSAGLDARSATVAQLRVVLEKIVPAELKKRGCEDAESVCREIGVRLAGQRFQEAAAESPQAVFARMGS
jgi:hypothetical protein